MKRKQLYWKKGISVAVMAAILATSLPMSVMGQRREEIEIATEVTAEGEIVSEISEAYGQEMLDVESVAEAEETTAYLFAYFTGSERNGTDEQIYFSLSEDGSQWTDLREDGDPVLISDVGERGVRDPFLIRSPQGDKFYLLATDLSIYNRTDNWATATTKGSTKLVIWESKDLVNWDEPRLVDVASKIPGAGCAWAPEAFYDENANQYVVYWATGSDESNAYGDRMNMYYATTSDFITFSDPVLWIDRESSIIDTTMIYDENTGKYYRASGDGEITIEQSDSIYEGWEIIGTLSSIFNNSNYSGSYLEGPEFFLYNQKDYLKDDQGNSVQTWGLMCDQYRQSKGYLPFRTTNLANMTTSSWSPASDVNFGALKKRHGTILPITNVEYEAVKKAYSEQLDPIIPADGILVDFDFDNVETGFSSTYAKSEGSYTLEDREDGKALYLNGTASNYLTVTDQEGGSILRGQEELTISYDTKAARSDTNWVMYAAPNGNTQTYAQERYLGILENGNTTTVERYKNSGGRPTNPSAATGSDWHHVDVAVTKTETIIYINGEEAARESSNDSLPSILGGKGILYIGKANWVSGEYFQGWIDNFKIYNKAYAPGEIPTPEPTKKPTPEPTAEPTQAPTKVAKVTGLKAVPSANSVKLTWKKVSGATGYEVYRGKGTGKLTMLKTITKGSTLSFTNSKLAKVSPYKYKVCAYKLVNKEKVYGAFSAEQEVITKPGKVNGVKIKRVGKVSAKTKATLEIKKTYKASLYRIYKYNKSKKKYEIAYKVQSGKLYKYNTKIKKYTKVSKIDTKNGKLVCTLTGLNLKSAKTMKFKVQAGATYKGYNTTYGAFSQTVTLK